MKKLLGIPSPSDKLTSAQNMIFVCGASRTGTTLACALLDTHSEIKMLSEFIFPIQIKLDDLDTWLASVDAEGSSPDGDILSTEDSKKVLAFLRRTGLSNSELREFLHSEDIEALGGAIDSFKNRLFFSGQLAKLLLQNGGTTKYIGFKLNNSGIFDARHLFPNAKFLVVTRDPVSTVNSQLVHGMAETSEFSERVLQNYYGKYFQFIRENPESAEAVSLELLSRAPARGLVGFLGKCPGLTTLNVNIDRMPESEVVKRGHINSKELGRGVRVVEVNSDNDVRISTNTKTVVKQGNFVNYGFPVNRYKKSFREKRKLNKPEYLDAVARVSADREIMTLRDLNRHCLGQGEQKRVGFVRHDIDHDLDNAVKLAEIDASLGIRATYCVLHDAPYYGVFKKNLMRYELSAACIESIGYIQSLGHEINFHNNLIVLAAREDVNPYTVLENELDNWWNLGIAICGTSTHGDKLCKQFGFRNWELFEECDLKSDGKTYLRMTIEQGDRINYRVVAKRCVPMSMFALEYEAYEFPKNIYISDSGGRLRENANVRGHSSKIDIFKPYDIQGLLTHPVWWNLDD